MKIPAISQSSHIAAPPPSAVMRTGSGKRLLDKRRS
jgi:hypothetical protein